MHNADAPTHHQGRCDNGHRDGLTTWCPTSLSSNGHHVASGSPPARHGKRGLWGNGNDSWKGTAVGQGSRCVCLWTQNWLILCSFLGASGASQRKVFLRPQGQVCPKSIPNRSGKLGKGNYSPQWATWPALWIPKAQPHWSFVLAFLTRINGQCEKEVKQSGYEVQMLPWSLVLSLYMSLGLLSFQQKNGPKLTLFIW